jgi:NodT family efflux transporter outer membrane factor (OMF) lipoprotein
MTPDTHASPGLQGHTLWQRLLSERTLKMLGAALLAGQLAACAPWIQESAESVSSARTIVPATWQDAPSTPANAVELAHWWGQFGDPTLAGLVEQALVSNNTIAAAQGRLRSARAAFDAAHGAQLPSLAGSGSASRQESDARTSIKLETYNLGLDAAWEVDLFGKLSGATAAAAAAVEGSQASLYDVQRVITADIALSYINLRDAQARLAIARDNLRTQRDNLEIAEWRNQAGLGNSLEVEQARTAVAQTRAIIPPFEQAAASAINQIDVLIGKPPGSSTQLLSPAAPLPTPPALIGLGIPADLLQRRPDVIAAQHNLEAEVIRIGVATADLYPALRLSGSLGTTSNSVGDLFDTSVGTILGGITAPIFQGGQIRARIEQQKGSADTALANYRSSILVALQDVDGALLSAKSSREREMALREAEESALQSLTLAEIRYRSGSIDFQTLLDTQRSVLVVQDSRASASAAYTTATVQLFKALGGGWPATSSN